MKKFLLGLVFLGFLLAIRVSGAEAISIDAIGDIFGDSGLPSGNFELPDADEFDTIGKNTNARSFIVKLVDFFLTFVGIIGVVAVIFAGFLWIASGGDDGMHEKAKKIVMFVAIGIIVILVSYAFVNTLIGAGGDQPPTSETTETNEMTTGGGNNSGSGGNSNSGGGNNAGGGNNSGSGGNSNSGGNSTAISTEDFSNVFSGANFTELIPPSKLVDLVPDGGLPGMIDSDDHPVLAQLPDSVLRLLPDRVVADAISEQKLRESDDISNSELLGSIPENGLRKFFPPDSPLRNIPASELLQLDPKVLKLALEQSAEEESPAVAQISERLSNENLTDEERIELAQEDFAKMSDSEQLAVIENNEISPENAAKLIPPGNGAMVARVAEADLERAVEILDELAKSGNASASASAISTIASKVSEQEIVQLFTEEQSISTESTAKIIARLPMSQQRSFLLKIGASDPDTRSSIEKSMFLQTAAGEVASFLQNNGNEQFALEKFNRLPQSERISALENQFFPAEDAAKLVRSENAGLIARVAEADLERAVEIFENIPDENFHEVWTETFSRLDEDFGEFLAQADISTTKIAEQLCEMSDGERRIVFLGLKSSDEELLGKIEEKLKDMTGCIGRDASFFEKIRRNFASSPPKILPNSPDWRKIIPEKPRKKMVFLKSGERGGWLASLTKKLTANSFDFGESDGKNRAGVVLGSQFGSEVGDKKKRRTRRKNFIDLPSGSLKIEGDGVRALGDSLVLASSADSRLHFSIEARGEAVFDFDDGSREVADATIGVDHFFGEKNVYTIRAAVESKDGELFRVSRKLIVGGARANFQISDREAEVGEAVKLSGDRSEAIFGKIARYEWSCAGRGCFENSTEKTVSVEFSAPGEHEITLRVQTSIGAVDEISKKIQIHGKIPVAKFSAKNAGEKTRPGRWIFDAGESFGTDGSGENLKFRWNFDGAEKTTNLSKISHEFETPGTKIVSLATMQSQDGKKWLESEVVEREIEVLSALAVDFEIPEKVWTEQKVDFVAKSPANRFEWEFPGGGKISGRRVSWIFREKGEFEVKLRAERDTDTNSISKRILVLNSGRPTAILRVFSPRDQKDFLIFGQKKLSFFRSDKISIVSGSFDKNGEQKSLRTSWTVDGESVFATELSKIFQKLGTHRVKLVAIDPDNPSERDEAEIQIFIKNSPPEIREISFFPHPTLGNSQVRVSAIGSDEDGEVEQWLFEVLEGEKSLLANLTSSPETFFDLSQFPGTKNLKFRATAIDSDDARTTRTSDDGILATNTIENSAPIVIPLAEPSNVGTPETEFFFHANFHDADGDALDFEWIFPDGERVFAPSARRKFPKIGKFTVRVRATDGIETVEKSIEVRVEKKVEISQKNQAPRAKILGLIPGNAGEAGTIFSFYGSGSDADGDALDFEWIFPDGRAKIQNVAWKFSKPGIFPVKLQVSDGTNRREESVLITIVPRGEKIVPSEQQPFKLPPANEFSAKIDWLGNCEDTLRAYKNQKIRSIRLEKSEKLRATLSNEILEINREFDECEEHPDSVRTEFREKMKTDFVAIRGGVETRFFLRGKIVKNTPRALFFEWIFPDGRRESGLKTVAKFSTPGLKKVKWKVSDGLTEITDSINILVE